MSDESADPNGAHPVHGIVFSHGAIGSALIEAVRAITGCDPGALEAISNGEAEPRQLKRTLADAVGDRPTIVFVDVAGGSCAFLAVAALAGVGYARVLTGVNLPILLDFVFNRHLEVGALADRLANTGRDSVAVQDGGDPAGHADRS